MWESDSKPKFKAALQSPNLQMIIQEYLSDINSANNVNTSAEQIENILITTAKQCLKIRTTRRHKRTYSSNKKWFDRECRLKTHELRKLSNEKHRDPLNTTLREKYHIIVLQQYEEIILFFSELASGRNPLSPTSDWFQERAVFYDLAR